MLTVAELYSLAYQHHQSRSFAEAETLYSQVVQAEPTHAAAWCRLGEVFETVGKPAQAEQCYRRGVLLLPGRPEPHNWLGIVLARQGRLAEAADSFKDALDVDPARADIHHNLAVALDRRGEKAKAIEYYRQALRLQPDFAQAHYNLGLAHLSQGDRNEAKKHFQEALRCRPDYAEAFNDLGNALAAEDLLDEAEVNYRHAVELRPDFAEAHYNLAITLAKQIRHVEAISQCEEALRLKPDFANARFNLALVRLLLGDFDRGFPGYEWRWVQPGFVRRSFQQPLWDGSDLGGRTILLHAEQGSGDTMQFLRYVPLVKERGGKVILECQASLHPLLAGFSGVERFSALGSNPPEFDIHAPLLSLPRIFQTSLVSIPAVVPYLKADQQLVDYWASRLQEIGGFKVGIAWQGNPTYQSDKQRSIPLASFASLAQVPGIQLISLQKGDGVDQLPSQRLLFPVVDFGAQLDDVSGAFMDTAAIMTHLDLVITSDTAIAHLAGALGRPVWVVLARVPDWRWLLERDDSPWYPTMRLFRQTHAGNWKDVFERMAQGIQQDYEQ